MKSLPCWRMFSGWTQELLLCKRTTTRWLKISGESASQPTRLFVGHQASMRSNWRMTPINTSSEPVHRNIKTDYPESTLSVKFRIFAHKEVPELQLTTGVCRKLAVVAGAAGHHFTRSTLCMQRKISPLTPLAKRRFKLRYRFEKIYHPTVICDLKYRGFLVFVYCNNHFRILHAC